MTYKIQLTASEPYTTLFDAVMVHGTRLRHVCLPRAYKSGSSISASLRHGRVMMPKTPILAASQQRYWMWQTLVLFQVTLQLDSPQELRLPDVDTP